MPIIAPPKEKETRSSYEQLSFLLPIWAIGVAGSVMVPTLAPATLLSLSAMTAAGVKWVNHLEDLKKQELLKPENRLKRVFGWLGLYALNKKREAIYPKLVHKHSKGSHHHLVYGLLSGMCIDDFNKVKPEIEQASGGMVELYMQNGLLHIDLWEGFLQKQYPFALLEPPDTLHLPFAVGYSHKGVIWADIAQLVNILIAGEPNSGKTNFIRQMLVQLLNYKHDDLDIYLYDFAFGSQFPEFQKYITVDYDVLNLASLLIFIYKHELIDRLKKLSRAGVEKKQDYPYSDMPYQVIIIDEQWFIVKDRGERGAEAEAKDLIKDYLGKIAAMGRKVGIHLIIGVQRPDKDVVDGKVKQGFEGKVCFKMINQTNSEIVLDHGGAALLREKGRCIYQFRGEDLEVQAMNLPAVKAAKLIPEHWRFHKPLFKVTEEIDVSGGF